MIDTMARLLGGAFSPRGLRIAIPLALCGIIGAGAAFAALEDRSLGDGLWWAAVTVTTVGYGDVTPTTTAGKSLAVALMLGGIGFLLLLAGALVEHFVAVEVEEHELLRRVDALAVQIEALTEQLRGVVPSAGEGAGHRMGQRRAGAEGLALDAEEEEPLR